jgi:hypothetical protein
MSTKPALAAHNIAFSHHLMPFSYDRAGFFKAIVQPSGYPYFAWSDRVLEVSADRKDFVDTGYIVQRDRATDTVTFVHRPD